MAIGPGVTSKSVQRRLGTQMTRKQYKAALARVSLLVDLDPHPDSLAGCELVRISSIVAAYEAVHFKFEQPAPEQLAEFRREQERGE